MVSGNFLVPQLKAYDQWVSWKEVPDKKGKIRKIPFGVMVETCASVADPKILFAELYGGITFRDRGPYLAKGKAPGSYQKSRL
jgi:hypothetical protein